MVSYPLLEDHWKFSVILDSFGIFFLAVPDHFALQPFLGNCGGFDLFAGHLSGNRQQATVLPAGGGLWHVIIAQIFLGGFGTKF